MFMVEDQSEIAGTGNKVHHLTFRNNVFRGARASAINGGYADYFVFANNVVADSNYSAIGLFHSPHMTVVNNVFYDNGGGSQIGDEMSKVGSVWDYNIHYPDFAWPHKQPEFGQHSMFGVDPGFVHSGEGDYRLRVDSLALNAGLALPEFNYDIDGVERPQCGAWDIGPHEEVPAVMLYGTPGDGFIDLSWTVNITPPVTATWRITYVSDTLPSPVVHTGIASPTRAYVVSGLSNYEWYTVTLDGMVDGTAWVSDTVRVMPTDIAIYLPLMAKED